MCYWENISCLSADREPAHRQNLKNVLDTNIISFSRARDDHLKLIREDIPSKEVGSRCWESVIGGGDAIYKKGAVRGGIILNVLKQANCYLCLPFFLTLFMIGKFSSFLLIFNSLIVFEVTNILYINMCNIFYVAA